MYSSWRFPSAAIVAAEIMPRSATTQTWGVVSRQLLAENIEWLSADSSSISS
jgi:hypothetical protein